MFGSADAETSRARVQRIWWELKSPRLVSSAAKLRVLEVRQERNHLAWTAARRAGNSAAVAALEAEADRLDDAVDELEEHDTVSTARGLLDESQNLVAELKEHCAETASDPDARASLFEAYQQASATQEAGQWFLLDWARRKAEERRDRPERRRATRRAAAAGATGPLTTEEEPAARRAASAAAAARAAASSPRPLPQRVEVLRRRGQLSPRRGASRVLGPSGGASSGGARSGETEMVARAERALGRASVQGEQLGLRQGLIYFGRAY